MKIHVINLFLSRKGGGIYTVINELYNSEIFKTKEYNNNLNFWGYKDEFSDVDSGVLNGNLNIFKIKNKFFFSRKLKNKFLKRKHDNSIVHLHSLWMYPSILLLNLKQAKKIISPHGMLDRWALNNSKIKKKISLFLFEKKNLNNANCIHALCRQEYYDIRKVAPKVPVAIIPNGINLPIKLAHNPTRKKSILFLGRLHPKKGIENLIDAWSDLSNDEWNLLIIGPDEGNYKEKIRQKIKVLKLENSISLLNPKYGKEKEELFRGVSAFILPSFSEGLPMVVLEAWSYNLPVLMTKECNLEIGFEKAAAIEIKTSIEGIKEGLEILINLSEIELADMGQAGYNLVKSNFTWDEVGKKMDILYRWVNGKVDKPDFVILE